MRAAAMAGTRKSLAQTGALITLSQTLDAAGLPYLVLKGQPLSVLLHGEPTRRRCGDIDLLVSPGDFIAAARLLAALGYRPAGDAPPLPDADGQAAPDIRDLTMVRNGIQVELHQRLTGNPHRLPLCFEALHADRQMVPVAGRDIPTLGPAHMALYLFVHGASHGWERLAWLCDLATLCRDGDQAARLVRQVHALGMVRAAGEAFALMRALFGSTPPPGLPVPASPGRLTRRLATGRGTESGGPAWLWHNLCWRWACWRLRAGPVAFLRELSHDLAPPTGRPPPSLLGRLALLVRPFGFLWRHLRPR